MSKKKMTVELEVPFVWPKEVTNFAPWEKKQFDVSNKEYRDNAKIEQSRGMAMPKRERSIIAEQAKALLNGETKWRPTWQTLPVDDILMPRKGSTVTMARG